MIDVNDPTGRFARASDEERSRFFSALAENGIGFVRRYSGGPDIHAACGMLAASRTGGTTVAAGGGGGLKARVRRAEEPGAIEEAARLLREGGLVAFPTETVYGLGANALDARAVARVFEAKARPSFDPLIVHLPEAAHLTRVAVPDARAMALAARFWPGPLSLVLPRLPVVPDLVTAGLDSVAVRVPDHPAALALLRAAGMPVAAPSANPFGYVSPTTVEHVMDQLADKVDLVLDGGPCRVGLESTISRSSRTRRCCSGRAAWPARIWRRHSDASSFSARPRNGRSRQASCRATTQPAHP